MADFPVDGCPSSRICFAGIEREEDTESRMDDHRSWGGASGVDERDISMMKGRVESGLPDWDASCFRLP